MEAMLTPVDEPLIRALNLDAPCRIADISCGGGRTTLEILRRAPAGSVVHGFDLFPASIELARSCKRSDEHAIAFEIADMATASRTSASCSLTTRLPLLPTWSAGPRQAVGSPSRCGAVRPASCAE
jgi:trans-aconitate methyltransferase